MKYESEDPGAEKPRGFLMQQGGGTIYDPTKRARHPVHVAELNDSATLAQLATRLDENLDAMTTAAARQAAMHAITILRGASRHLTP